MKHAYKHLLIASLITAFGATAYAQAPAGAPAPGPGGPGMGRMAQGDPAKFEAYRAERQGKVMAALKAKLQLSAAQESAWTTFAAAMQPPARIAADRAQFRAEMEKLTTPERIDKMQAFKAQRNAEMTKRGDATKAFYVQGSKKHGSMGATLATFGAQADADKFVAENGGKALKFGELTPDMVRLDGGMQHDQHM